MKCQQRKIPVFPLEKQTTPPTKVNLFGRAVACNTGFFIRERTRANAFWSGERHLGFVLGRGLGRGEIASKGVGVRSEAEFSRAQGRQAGQNKRITANPEIKIPNFYSNLGRITIQSNKLPAIQKP